MYYVYIIYYMLQLTPDTPVRCPRYGVQVFTAVSVFFILVTLCTVSLMAPPVRRNLKTCFWSRAITYYVVVLAPMLMVLVWAALGGGDSSYGAGGEADLESGNNYSVDSYNSLLLREGWNETYFNISDFLLLQHHSRGIFADCEKDSSERGDENQLNEGKIKSILCVHKDTVQTKSQTEKPIPTTVKPKEIKLRIRRPKHHRQMREGKLAKKKNNKEKQNRNKIYSSDNKLKNKQHPSLDQVISNTSASVFQKRSPRQLRSDTLGGSSTRMYIGPASASSGMPQLAHYLLNSTTSRIVLDADNGDSSVSLLKRLQLAHRAYYLLNSSTSSRVIEDQDYDDGVGDEGPQLQGPLPHHRVLEIPILLPPTTEPPAVTSPPPPTAPTSSLAASKFSTSGKDVTAGAGKRLIVIAYPQVRLYVYHIEICMYI